MMGRIVRLTAFACGVALFACQLMAKEETFQQGLDRRIGQPVSAYAIDHGPPQASFAIGVGQQAFQWTFNGQTPGMTAPLGNMTVFLPPRAIQCNVTLIAKTTVENPTLGDWMVTSTKYNGACR